MGDYRQGKDRGSGTNRMVAAEARAAKCKLCGYAKCRCGKVMGDTQELIELRPLREWQKKAKAPRAFAVPAYEDFAPMVQWMDHAADTIASLQRSNEKLREAVRRLGSSEVMTTAFLRRDNREGLELLARIEFARQALEDTDSGN